MLPFFFVLSSFCFWFCVISIDLSSSCWFFLLLPQTCCWALLVTFHLSYCTLQLQNFCLVYFYVYLFIDIWWGIVFIHMFSALDMVSFRSLSILKWLMLSFWLGSLIPGASSGTLLSIVFFLWMGHNLFFQGMPYNFLLKTGNFGC